MKLIPPALPGMALVMVAGEVAYMLAPANDAAGAIAPIVVQLLTSVGILGGAVWIFRRVLANERDTATRFETERREWEKRITAMEERIRERDDEIREREEIRHRENVARMDAMTSEMGRMSALLLGIQGYGGLLTEQKINQDRRHQLAEEMAVLVGRVHYLELSHMRVCEKLREPFEPLPADPPPRRRRGDRPADD